MPSLTGLEVFNRTGGLLQFGCFGAAKKKGRILANAATE
jgi:hypothetical protein